MRNNWAGIFLMLFLVGGGMLIGTNNAAFVDSNLTAIGLVSLISFGIFVLLVYEDEIRDALASRKVPDCFGDEEYLYAASACYNLCEVYRECTEEVVRKSSL